MDEFYTVDELAERLKLKETTIRGWIREGKIRAVRFGRTYRIPADEYERVRKEGVSDGPQDDKDQRLALVAAFAG